MIALFSWSECEMDEFLWSLGAGFDTEFWSVAMGATSIKNNWTRGKNSILPRETPTVVNHKVVIFWSSKNWIMLWVDDTSVSWFPTHPCLWEGIRTVRLKVFFASGFGKISTFHPPWHFVKYQLPLSREWDPYFMAYYHPYSIGKHFIP